MGGWVCDALVLLQACVLFFHSGWGAGKVVDSRRLATQARHVLGPKAAGGWGCCLISDTLVPA